MQKKLFVENKTSGTFLSNLQNFSSEENPDIKGSRHLSLVNFTVTEILEPPFEDGYKEERWWARTVMANSCGKDFYKVLTFETEAEAEAVSVGCVFQE